MTNNNAFDIAINDISPAQMQALLNQTFHLQDGQAITLVEVQTNQSQQTPYSWQQNKDSTEQSSSFSIVFRFPLGQNYQQGTYPFSHPEEDVFEGLFLTPITKDENGLYLEAIFS